MHCCHPVSKSLPLPPQDPLLPLQGLAAVGTFLRVAALRLSRVSSVMPLSHAGVCTGSPTAAATTFQSVDLSARSTSQTVPGLPHCLHISCTTQLQASDRRRSSDPARRLALGGAAASAAHNLPQALMLPKAAVGSAREAPMFR